MKKLKAKVRVNARGKVFEEGELIPFDTNLSRNTIFFEVVDIEEPIEEPIEEFKKEDLKALLDEKGIEYSAKAKKAELEELLKNV